MPAANGALLERMVRDRLSKDFEDRFGVELQPLPSNSGIRGGGFDIAFEMKGPVPVRRLYVQVKSRPLREYYQHFAKLARELSKREKASIALLVFPKISSRSKVEMRAQGINYADLSGSMFIRGRRFYVDVDQNREADWTPQPSKVNPFSRKASLVLRMLFEQPEKDWRITEIAKEANLTKGWASVVSSELLNRGYVTEQPKGLRVADASRILADWRAYYSWSRNSISSYVAPFEYQEILAKLRELSSLHRRGQAALTLLAGADQVVPHVQHGQVHLYVSPLKFSDITAAIREHLFLEPAAKSGSVHLVDPYYGQSTFYGSRLIDGLPVVSDVQLYLDLAEYPARGPEAAAMLLRRRLAPHLKIAPSKLESLT